MLQDRTAVLFDCLGTLLELEPPAPRLAAALGIPLDAAERAIAAEIAYYRAHMHEARDAESLADLRARCAQIAGCDVPTLMDTLVFTPFPEVHEVLSALHAGGKKLVVVSNWDVSLHDVLIERGLTLFDHVVTSAEVGAAKPDPAPLRAALELVGADPHEALMVGDSDEDVAAARAAGVAWLRLERPRVTLSALLSYG